MEGVEGSALLRNQALFMQVKSMTSLTNLVQAKPLLRELEGAQEELINMSIFLVGQAHGVAGVVDEANEFFVDLKK